jgi:hypothetical protein
MVCWREQPLFTASNLDRSESVVAIMLGRTRYLSYHLRIRGRLIISAGATHQPSCEVSLRAIIWTDSLPDLVMDLSLLSAITQVEPHCRECLGLGSSEVVLRES